MSPRSGAARNSLAASALGIETQLRPPEPQRGDTILNNETTTEDTESTEKEEAIGRLSADTPRTSNITGMLANEVRKRSSA